MDFKLMRRWEHEREVGFFAYVLRTSVLGFGAPMALLLLAMREWRGKLQPGEYEVTFTAVSYGFIAFLLGSVRWHWAESQRVKYQRMIAEGHCAECGYDLRATPGRCPECGHVPSPSSTAAKAE